MIANFSLERVTKAPASFDPKKLWAFEDHYMQQLPLERESGADAALSCSAPGWSPIQPGEESTPS